MTAGIVLAARVIDDARTPIIHIAVSAYLILLLLQFHLFAIWLRYTPDYMR